VKGVTQCHSLTKTMPPDPRVSPPQRSVLSVEMAPLPADVHPASYQAMLLAYHHMGVPIDPYHLPRAPYAGRYSPYHRLPVGPIQTYDDLRVGKGENFPLKCGEGESV